MWDNRSKVYWWQWSDFSGSKNVSNFHTDQALHSIIWPGERAVTVQSIRLSQHHNSWKIWSLGKMTFKAFYRKPQISISVIMGMWWFQEISCEQAGFDKSNLWWKYFENIWVGEEILIKCFYRITFQRLLPLSSSTTRNLRLRVFWSIRSKGLFTCHEHTIRLNQQRTQYWTCPHILS